MVNKVSSQHLIERTTPATSQCSQSEFDVLVDLLGTDEPKSPCSSRQHESCLNFNMVGDMFTEESKGNDVPLERYFEDFAPYPNSADPPRITQLDIGHVPDERTFQAGLSGENVPGQPGGNEDLIDLSLDNSFEGSSVTNQTPPPPSSPARKNNGNAPTSMRSVLDIGRREAETLREHCKELEDHTRKSGGRIPVASADVGQSVITSDNAYLATVPLGSNHDVEGERQLDFDVDTLSLSQARRILKRLVEDRTIPASIVQGIFDQIQESNDGIISSTSTELLRARDFTLFIDELVWRRSHFGSDYDNPLSHENVEALKDRVELWEHVARRR